MVMTWFGWSEDDPLVDEIRRLRVQLDVVQRTTRNGLAITGNRHLREFYIILSMVENPKHVKHEISLASNPKKTREA